MTYAFYALLTFFIVLCVLFAGLILIQKGRGGGISSAFGGAGGNTAFGSKTGDVLTWATSVVFAIFLICCVSLSLLAAKVNAEATGTGVVAPATAVNSALPSVAPTTAPAVPDLNPPTTNPTTQPTIVTVPVPAN
jgi:preprotein translocase subunit SecG